MRLTRFNYCAASMREHTEWLGDGERNARGLWTCALCGKVVLLRRNRRGWRAIVPTHTPLLAVIAKGEKP
jgi:hypothetical protein